MGNVKFSGAFHRALVAVGLLPKGFINNRVVDYDDMVRGMLSRPDVDWTRFPCVTPSWDNSARRKNASIFFGSTPDKYEAWLRQIVAQTSQKHVGEEKIVFINAWNEWAEGNHLEPDIKWGRAYLEATRRGLEDIEAKLDQLIPYMQQSNGDGHPVVKQLYWKMQAFLKAQLDLLKNLGPKR